MLTGQGHCNEAVVGAEKKKRISGSKRKRDSHARFVSTRGEFGPDGSSKETVFHN